MKDLAGNFLSEDEQQEVISSVQEAEKITSGEIVPMVVSTSYHYPLANVIGALLFSLTLAIIVTLTVSIRKMWLVPSHYDMWIFPAVLALSFPLFHELIKRMFFLKRLFISAAEIDEEVEEAALTSFYRKGLGNTRDKTGILIFISVFERKVWVLADEGINEKVDPGAWQEIVDIVTLGIKEKRQGPALCNAIKRCGELLESNFPIKPDDTDELDNLIIERK